MLHMKQSKDITIIKGKDKKRYKILIYQKNLNKMMKKDPNS